MYLRIYDIVELADGSRGKVVDLFKENGIEKLKGKDEEFLLKNYSFDKYYDEYITKAKVEAIKEFANLKIGNTVNICMWSR